MKDQDIRKTAYVVHTKNIIITSLKAENDLPTKLQIANADVAEDHSVAMV